MELALSGDFKEKNEKKIHLKTYSTNAVELFIKFLYGFELKTTNELAKELTVMGGVYNISSLQRAAFTALVPSVDLDHMASMMDFVKINSTEAADAFFGDHIANMLKTYINMFEQRKDHVISSELLMKHPEIAVKLLKLGVFY